MAAKPAVRIVRTPSFGIKALLAPMPMPSAVVADGSVMIFVLLLV
ncbi:MAG: hypothetical protein ACR2J5_11640 [Geodermatophilaceae bacterium]